MVAKHFNELACWQLSVELKRRVYALIARHQIARDFKFCDQIRESTRSAPSNIAEGFGKYDPPEFKRYLNIAIGSLTETQNHLHDGLDQKYLKETEHAELVRLAKRARGAAIALRKYLESCPRKHRPTKRDSGTPEDNQADFKKNSRPDAGDPKEPGRTKTGNLKREPRTQNPEP